MPYIWAVNSLIADISLWRFPASLILAAAFVAALWAVERYYAHTRFYRLLTDLRTAVALLLVTAALCIAEGTVAAGLYHSWPFIGFVLLLTASLGLTVLHGLRMRRSAGFLLNHAGLFLILWGALFGAPDVTQARMQVRRGESNRLAVTDKGQLVPLPFEIRLERFAAERYDDGSPRQFRSELLLDGQPAEVEVNAPLRHRGYTLYQDGYDTQRGAYTVLLVVRDPWLRVVWLGVALLAAGSLLILFRK